MRTSLLFGCLLLALTGCSTLPEPAQSSYFRAIDAGYDWHKNGNACARFALAVSANAPQPLYVEAVLPLPDGSASVPIRQTVSNTNSHVSFEGPFVPGWKHRAIYLFQLRAYSDAGYTKMIDSLEQRSLCIKPPEDILRRLKDY
jgi:hypothetical protein